MCAGVVARGSFFQQGEAALFLLISMTAAWIGFNVYRGRGLASFLAAFLAPIGAIWAALFGVVASAYGQFDSVRQAVPFIVAVIALPAAAVAAIIVCRWDTARARENAARTGPPG